jgi:hypothetical protein
MNRQQRKQGGKPRSTRRLIVEALEDRSLLAPFFEPPESYQSDQYSNQLAQLIYEFELFSKSPFGNEFIPSDSRLTIGAGGVLIEAIARTSGEALEEQLRGKEAFNIGRYEKVIDAVVPFGRLHELDNLSELEYAIAPIVDATTHDAGTNTASNSSPYEEKLSNVYRNAVELIRIGNAQELHAYDNTTKPIIYDSQLGLRTHLSVYGITTDILERLAARGLAEISTYTSSVGTESESGITWANVIGWIHPYDLEGIAQINEVFQIDLPSRGVLRSDVPVDSPPSAITTTPDRFDVDGDGRVYPADALIIIDALNAADSGGGNILASTPFGSRVDTDQDGLLAPADALIVINILNISTGGSETQLTNTNEGAEGEAPKQFTDQDALVLAAADDLCHSLSTRRKSVSRL